MKPLPFPLALHLGTDIVHIPRIARLVTRPGNYLARFTRRILCAQEQRDFTTRFALPPSYTSESLLSQSQRQSPTITPDMTRWLAGRFAAKEAARKAAPTGGAGSIGWKDVMVRAEEEDSEKMSMKKGKSSRPEIVFLGVGGRRIGWVGCLFRMMESMSLRLFWRRAERLLGLGYLYLPGCFEAV